MLQGLERLAFYRLFDNISMKSNNLSLIRNIWVKAMEGHSLITSKSTAILTATVSNTASHFGGRNDFTGGGGKSFHWGGAIAPPRYIVKKGTVTRIINPPVSIFGNPSFKPPPRIERWALRLQPYQLTVHYRKGEGNPADYLSRHPLK